MYESYPTPYQLDLFGLDEKKVAISFDDGPSLKYTEKVLDVLQEYDVKAVFFPIDLNAAMHPGLVQKIYEEGHEIGNHTFTHADVLKIKENELEFELNATQRVLQGITGHSTVLLRSPFLSTNDGLGRSAIYGCFRKNC